MKFALYVTGIMVGFVGMLWVQDARMWKQTMRTYSAQLEKGVPAEWSKTQ